METQTAERREHGQGWAREGERDGGGRKRKFPSKSTIEPKHVSVHGPSALILPANISRIAAE